MGAAGRRRPCGSLLDAPWMTDVSTSPPGHTDFGFGIGIGIGFGIALGIGFGIGFGIGLGLGIGIGSGPARFIAPGVAS